MTGWFPASVVLALVAIVVGIIYLIWEEGRP